MICKHIAIPSYYYTVMIIILYLLYPVIIRISDTTNDVFPE